MRFQISVIIPSTEKQPNYQKNLKSLNTELVMVQHISVMHVNITTYDIWFSWISIGKQLIYCRVDMCTGQD